MVVCVLAGCIACQPSYAGNPKDQPSSNNSLKPRENSTLRYDNERSVAHPHKTNDDPPSWQAAIKQPEWWLVVAAFGLIVVICWQSWETRSAAQSALKQAATYRERECARISVKPKQEGFYDFKDPPAAGMWEAAIEITQHGATKAFNVTGWAEAIVTPSDSLPPRKGISQITLPEVIDERSGPLVEEISGAPFMDAGLLTRIKERHAFVHLFGAIRYVDVFGYRHETKFRYMWTVRSYTRTREGLALSLGEPGWEKVGGSEENQTT